MDSITKFLKFDLRFESLLILFQPILSDTQKSQNALRLEETIILKLGKNISSIVE